MSRLLFLAPVLVVFVACNNQGREAYYQSRATPTSSADAYSISAQLAWESNRRQIYELPPEPPDRQEMAPPRVDCERPGPKFKPIPLVAWGNRPVVASDQSDLTPLVATKMERPKGEEVWIRQHPMVGGYGSLYRPGISQPPYLVSTGTTDRRPRSITGAGLSEKPAQPLMGYNDHTNPYCDHPEGTGVLPVDPPPAEEKRSGVETSQPAEMTVSPRK